MNTRIIGISPLGNSYEFIDIFGYCSKGLPGIELIIPGKNGRAIKEKFVYLTRVQRLKMPLRRYVLCVEGNSHVLKDCSWLELPLLILLWSLSGNLPIKKLDDCFSSGRVSVTGEVEVLNINWPRFENAFKMSELLSTNSENLKYIANCHQEVPDYLFNLGIEFLFEGKDFLRFS